MTKKKQKNNSVKEKLKELKSMFEEELITQEEYDAWITSKQSLSENLLGNRDKCQE